MRGVGGGCLGSGRWGKWINSIKIFFERNEMKQKKETWVMSNIIHLTDLPKNDRPYGSCPQIAHDLREETDCIFWCQL